MDSQLLWGTAEMLIMDVVAAGPTYGYQIVQQVAAESKGYFELKEGSLYPALHRLERQKLLSSYWGKSPEGRRRKYYKLTAKGRGELAKRRREWARFSEGVEGVLGRAYGTA